MARTTFLTALAAAAATLFALGCHPARPASGMERGEQLFGSCTPCHGIDGSGNQEQGAPPIAGLEQWYIEAQLTKFRDGIRGKHPDDYSGLRMRPMARSLNHEGDVESVTAWVAGMTPVPDTSASLGGDAAKGRASYAVCTACHGPQGKGNEQLNAPAIAGHPEWYMLAQLQKFKAGVRGGNPEDVTGSQMVGMAGTLADEQAMKDVIAHIKTLK